jgi:Sulfotransferase family
MALPDFFVIGAPKAGTTALHAALTAHPQLFQSAVKEPKFYLTGERRPRGFGQRGPGDAHSAKEWIWRRADYEALFDSAPAGLLRGESTPFYLYDLKAQQRIHADVPGAKLIAVIRDPIDRAYSNWMHLRSDGLEPIADFEEAWAAEDGRVAAGWAPFWHYRRLGMYGEQLEHATRLFGANQVHVLRYRELVENPVQALDGVCRFLGIATGVLTHVPRQNSKSFAPDSPRHRALSQLVRAGAHLGQYAPPHWWRGVEAKLVGAMQSGGAMRPRLAPEVRVRLVQEFAADNALLGKVTGRSFADWMGATSRGQFTQEGSHAAKE